MSLLWTQKFLFWPDGIDVAVVQSVSFGDAGTVLALVSKYRQAGAKSVVKKKKRKYKCLV